MRKVPKGKLTTINEIRSALARKHRVDVGCPVTTGIFAWIAANADEQAINAGLSESGDLGSAARELVLTGVTTLEEVIKETAAG